MSSSEISRIINEVMTAPNFPRAAEIYVDRFLRVFTSYKYIIKLQSDEGRYLVSLQQCAHLLDTRHEDELTASALYSFAVKNGLSTKSRVSAMLALAVMGQYLQWEVGPSDRRKKFYRPTETYLKLVRDTHLYYTIPLSELAPDTYGCIMERDRRFVGKVARAAAHIYLHDMRLAEKIRGMHLLSYRDGGYEVFMRILQEARHFSDEPMTVITMPFAQVANDFGISRSQVQKIVKSFAELGLLILHGTGGRDIELLPALHGFATEVVASGLGIYANAVQRVMAENIDS